MYYITTFLTRINVSGKNYPPTDIRGPGHELYRTGICKNMFFFKSKILEEVLKNV